MLLHYDTMNNPQPSQHGLDMQTWSTDDGLTWSKGTVLSYPPAINMGALIGPSVGIQAATGTIFFSCCFPTTTGQYSHRLYWSKDFGKTWTSSKPVMGCVSTRHGVAWCAVRVRHCEDPSLRMPHAEVHSVSLCAFYSPVLGSRQAVADTKSCI